MIKSHQIAFAKVEKITLPFGICPTRVANVIEIATGKVVATVWQGKHYYEVTTADLLVTMRSDRDAVARDLFDLATRAINAGIIANGPPSLGEPVDEDEIRKALQAQRFEM